MPGWVQFDRPQRCWFWLLYSCVHRCAAAAALSRAEGMRVGCAASAQSGLLVCYMTLASNEAAAPRRALEAATGGTKLTHRRTDSSPIPQIRISAHPERSWFYLAGRRTVGCRTRNFSV